MTDDVSPNWDDIHTRLSEPFPPEEEGAFPKGKLTLTFINARSVMERLDQVVGPDHWEDKYRTLDPVTCAVECTLSVYGVSKADMGYPNDPGDADNAGKEPLKAAYSDALKRAAVKWGIGRYLYPKAGQRGSPQATPPPRQNQTKPASREAPKPIPFAGKGMTENPHPDPDPDDSVALAIFQEQFLTIWGLLTDDEVPDLSGKDESWLRYKVSKGRESLIEAIERGDVTVTEQTKDLLSLPDITVRKP